MGPYRAVFGVALILLAFSASAALSAKAKKNMTRPLLLSKKIDETGIAFCDKDKYFTSLKSACPLGFVFKEQKPACLCIKGIYRIYLDDCQLADGFIQGQTCTFPYDQHNGAQIHSIQVLPEPNWLHTHVVFEKASSDGSVGRKNLEMLSFVPGGRRLTASTETEQLYTINARPFIVTLPGGKQSLCVEPYSRKYEYEGQICHYFRKANQAIWNSSTNGNLSTEVIIQSNCLLLSNKTAKLAFRSCFDPLTNTQAECHLPCDRESETPNVDLLDDRKRVWGTGDNCTDEHESLKHDNQFLERKMTQYSLMSNIREVGPLRPMQPNRTFELFDKMIKLANRYCPDHFVPDEWVEYVMDLFYVIHKGRQFKYEEVLSEAEFVWIRDILDGCLEQEYEIDLIVDPNVNQYSYNKSNVTGGDICEGDTEQAYGFCNSLDTMGANCTDPVQIRPTAHSTGQNLKDKHYVPELAFNVLDITQAICFKEFNESYRMFHVLEQAVEKLFTTQINGLWYHPPYLNDNKAKEKLLGMGSDDIMYNMDICVSSAYVKMTKNQIPRLQRLTKLELVRRKRAVTATTTFPMPKKAPAQFCAKSNPELALPSKCSLATNSDGLVSVASGVPAPGPPANLDYDYAGNADLVGKNARPMDPADLVRIQKQNAKHELHKLILSKLSVSGTPQSQTETGIRTAQGPQAPTYPSGPQMPRGPTSPDYPSDDLLPQNQALTQRVQGLAQEHLSHKKKANKKRSHRPRSRKHTG